MAATAVKVVAAIISILGLSGEKKYVWAQAFQL
jgi:hypothetical protein